MAQGFALPRQQHCHQHGSAPGLPQHTLPADMAVAYFHVPACSHTRLVLSHAWPQAWTLVGPASASTLVPWSGGSSSWGHQMVGGLGGGWAVEWKCEVAGVV
jgi:hypothetical protein